MSNRGDRQQISGAPAALAPSVAADSVLQPAGRSFATSPSIEKPAPFVYPLEWEVASLVTSGFEGIESEIEAAPPVAAAVEPEPVAPVEDAHPAPAAKPFELPAELPAVTIYEPLEIMDYEEFESEPFYEAEAEPEPEPEPEPAPPAFIASSLPMAEVRPAAPATAKMLGALGPMAYPEPETILPVAELVTCRPRVVAGKNPHAPVAVPAPAPPAPAPVEMKAAPVETKPQPQEEKPAPVQAKPATVEPKPVEPKPAAPAASPDRTPSPAPAPVPVDAPKPVITEKPRVAVRPAPPERDRRSKPQVPAQPSRPAIAARDHGNAVPVEREIPQAPPPPAPKPKVMPMPSRRHEPEAEPAATPAAAKNDPIPMIGMPPASGGGMSGIMRVAVAGAVLAVLGCGGYFMFSGKSSTAATVAEDKDATPSSLIVGGGGWTTTWGSDAAINKNKQISIYRPSMAMSDYRFEFRGQIDRKALGWVFRASNAKNYYVMKLETIKPGANPLVALVKYAVVDGKETTRTQVMLPFDVKIDTLYQVRLDVRGDKFSTYVQEKLVDFWTDDRIKTGGVGFYTEPGERASIKTSQVAYLTSNAAAK